MNEILDLLGKMLEEQGYKNVIGFYLQVDWSTKQVVYGVNYLATDKNGEFILDLSKNIMKRLTHGEIAMVKKSDVPIL